MLFSHYYLGWNFMCCKISFHDQHQSVFENHLWGWACRESLLWTNMEFVATVNNSDEDNLTITMCECWKYCCSNRRPGCHMAMVEKIWPKFKINNKKYHYKCVKANMCRAMSGFSAMLLSVLSNYFSWFYRYRGKRQRTKKCSSKNIFKEQEENMPTILLL